MKTRFLLTMILCAAISFAYAQDVLSSKQNIPVKKETFTSKLERYKSEGFKVAVILTVSPLTTKVPSTSSTSMKIEGEKVREQIVLKGEIALDDSDFTSLAASYAAQMNEAFGTDVFEVVDLSNIPKKESKWGEVYEWGKTKYKMVANYWIGPSYDFSKFSDKKTAKFIVNQSALVLEYIYDKKKGFKIKYPVRVGGLGFYTMSYDEEGALEGLKTVEELHAIVNPPMGADLATELQKAYDEKMPDYIAKRKK